MNQNDTVLAAVKTMTHAFHEQDIQGVMASYETDAAVMFEPGQRVEGGAEIAQSFQGAFQINPTFEYPNGHEVFQTEDLALHIAPWVMTGTAPDGTKVKKTGLSVSVLRKQTNGEWLLVLDNPHGQVLLEA